MMIFFFKILKYIGILGAFVITIWLGFLTDLIIFLAVGNLLASCFILIT
jgi:hypothetical protein